MATNRRIYLRDIPLWVKRDYKVIGRGDSAIVYDYSETQVLVCRNGMGDMTMDWQFDNFDCLDLTCRVGVNIGFCSRIYIMEKLTPLDRKERIAINKKLLESQMRINNITMYRGKEPKEWFIRKHLEAMAYELPEDDDVMWKVRELLLFSLNYDFEYTKAQFDLHAFNWMKKGSEFVINDPFHAREFSTC